MTKAMKDSGVDWIGKIPEDWCVRRLKVLAKLQTGNTPPKENSTNIYYTDEGFLWVKPDNLYGFNPIKNTNEHLNEEGYQIAKVAPAGAPLVCCIGTIGKYGVSDQDVAYNQQINAVIFNDRMDKKFGLYHISCQEEQHWFYANGNVVQILNTQNQGKILLSCPPIQEQQKIADYLDKKCGEIDKVVETEKAVIEKLKEYKQSIITEAVTKGLDKSVPLKDSGIEWIGKIPAHWEVKRTKFAADSFDKGNGITKEDVLSDGDIQCIRYGEIYSKYDKQCSETVSATNVNMIDSPKYISKGDILFAGTGELIEEIGKNIVYTGNDPCLAGGDIIILKHKQNHIFLNYVLNSHYAQSQKSYGKVKLKVVHISASAIGNVRIALPPLEEQQQIANYLDKKCSEIDQAITHKEQVIEKFTEYKKSLIYECVTGKKEVA